MAPIKVVVWVKDGCRHICPPLLSGVSPPAVCRLFKASTLFIPFTCVLTHVRLFSKPGHEPSKGPKLPMRTVCAIVS